MTTMKQSQTCIAIISKTIAVHSLFFSPIHSCPFKVATPNAQIISEDVITKKILKNVIAITDDFARSKIWNFD